MSEIQDLIKAIGRSAEISALSVAMQNRHTCVICGLFATLQHSDAIAPCWTDDKGTVFCVPHFCDACYKGLQCNGPKVQEMPGAIAARRLNTLLRGE